MAWPAVKSQKKHLAVKEAGKPQNHLGHIICFATHQRWPRGLEMTLT